MIEISKEANLNYLAKIVKLENIRKHNNADKLQIVSIDFQDVITGLDANEGDIYVYFPVECKINPDFLSYTNSFRDKELNQDKDKVGFFESTGRVKAVRLRGEKSMGYIVPIEQVLNWSFGHSKMDYIDYVTAEFDTVNNIKLVEKYQVKVRQEDKVKQGKKPRLSRLIDGQVHLHTDTENLRKNVHKLKLDDTISITYKTHGTSWWVSNVLVKKQLNWFERLLSKVIKVVDTEYDILYGSRKVVKNQHFDPKGKDHYFGYDLWADIKDQVADKIPKGYTLYGECLGYTKNGSPIQGSLIEDSYDYGCIPVLPDYASKTHYNKVWKNYYSKVERDEILNKYNINWDKPYSPNLKDLDIDITRDIDLSRDNRKQFKLEVYRITHTTPDGLVTELSYPQIKEFCDKAGLTPSHLFYYGTVRNYFENNEYFTTLPSKEWQEMLLKCLEEDYNEKDCFMCNNKVPEEGIVVRKESLFNCESYKLKSFKFLEYESKELDKNVENIEENN